MFLIGLELNPSYLKGNIKTAILISNFSIFVPFFLASLLAILLYPLVSNNTVSFTAFTLFLGSAMSITAFPVLARIITENNLQKTRLGTLALTCAAVDDVTAWCLLALAITVIRTNSVIGAIPTIFESIVYIVFMLTAVRWLLKKLEIHYQRTQKLTQFVLALIYIGVVVSALMTESIGIHLIFGAFLLGVAMPKKSNLVKELAEKTEDFILIFLLPIFFAYSGLQTQIGLLNRPGLWLLCAAVVTVAISGKYIGTYFAARFCGINKREASALGWLMNTRGLTELIILNIGLSLGVISPLLFTMLVIMALATTLMTSPLLEWTFPKEKIRADFLREETPSIIISDYKILVPVANPNTQKNLLKIAISIAGNTSSFVHLLSLIELNEDYFYQSIPTEVNRLIQQQKKQLRDLIKSLEPVELRNIIYPLVRIANDVPQETVKIALAQQINLIIVGWHRPAFSENRLGGRVGKILNTSPVDTAVLVDKNLEQIQSILVAYAENIHDDLALSLALRMLGNNPSITLQVFRFTPAQSTQENVLSYEFIKMLDLCPTSVKSRVKVNYLEDSDPIRRVIEASQYVDLTFAGTSRTWGIERQTLGAYTDQLAQECRSSLLIARCYSPMMSHLTSVFPANNL